MEELQRVLVSLADGKKVPMLMSAGGVMISTDMKVEPNIPLGWLAEIGCRISWTQGGLEVTGIGARAHQGVRDQAGKLLAQDHQG